MILKDILEAVEKATGTRPTAFTTDEISTLPAINYTFYRASDNGAVATYRFQLRTTASTLQEVLDLEQKAARALVTVGDSRKFDCSIQTNGGGSLRDEATGSPQQITYFDITTRS